MARKPHVTPRRDRYSMLSRVWFSVPTRGAQTRIVTGFLKEAMKSLHVTRSDNGVATPPIPSTITRPYRLSILYRRVLSPRKGILRRASLIARWGEMGGSSRTGLTRPYSEIERRAALRSDHASADRARPPRRMGPVGIGFITPTGRPLRTRSRTRAQTTRVFPMPVPAPLKNRTPAGYGPGRPPAGGCRKA